MNPEREVRVFIDRASLAAIRKYVWPDAINRTALEGAVLDNLPIQFVTKTRPDMPFTGAEAAHVVDGRVKLQVYGPRGGYLATIIYSTGGKPRVE